MSFRAIKVAVVMGGVSPEHEISLRSGATALARLPSPKYRLMAVVIGQDGRWRMGEGREGMARLGPDLRPEEALARLIGWGVDAAFLALHGPNGEDGTIQGFFQSAGVPYTGPSVEAAAISMNKHLSRVLASSAGVRVPPGLLLSRADFQKGGAPASKAIEFPVYVKTLRSGSSLGVFLVERPELFSGFLEEAFAFGDEVLIEKAVAGREITCGVLALCGGRVQALPPVEIRPKQGRFFNFRSKYNADLVEEICPAPLDPDSLRQVKEIAEKLCRSFRVLGLSRADFIFDGTEFWFLELNTIPGFTAESIVLKEAAAAGISLETLFDEIVMACLPEPLREEKAHESE